MESKREHHNLAVFADFDNQKVDLAALSEFLREKGKIVIRRAYADWVRSESYRKAVVMAGFDLIDCPKIASYHKNSADLRMTVDCLVECYENNDIQTFVLVSGDVDFVPLVNKLRSKGRDTIIVAAQNTTSGLLQMACDEFVPLSRLNEINTASPETGLTLEDAIELFERARNHIMQNFDTKKVNLLSFQKGYMLQLNPSFHERDFGFKSFKDFYDYSISYIENREEDETVTFKGLRILVETYNKCLIEYKSRNIKPEHFKKSLPRDFNVKNFDCSTIDEWINRAISKGILFSENKKLHMIPMDRIKSTLRFKRWDHTPEIRKKILASFKHITEEAKAKKYEYYTLKEMSDKIFKLLNGKIKRGDINSVLNSIRITGILKSLDGDVQISLNLPFKIEKKYLDDLVSYSIAGQLILLSGACTIFEDEIETLTEILVGSYEDAPKIIDNYLGMLINQGHIKKVGPQWKREWNIF